MFKKILIANRGEIALRIHRACKEMGISTVAVHSEADASALHVKLADEAVCIGPAPANQSYLNIPAILSAAELTDSEAIHPGYGFLSENAKFAEIIKELGFTFIGPAPEHIRQMGDKIEAISTAQRIGLPTIPGSCGAINTIEEAISSAEKIGYPIILKAASGGGGKGMKVAHSEGALRAAYNIARSEAKAAFGDERVYLEKYLQNPRHIEVQILADTHGNVITLGERDCSLQRRHQKVLEEAPSPILTQKQRDKLLYTCQKAISKLGYLGAGTIEFLYENGEFFFIEMNTRLQVEHPVTEMTTGVDLVQEQIRIAAGLPMKITKNPVALRGHSIECRINAEDPITNLPRPGTVTDYYPAGGPGVRIDSALYPGYSVPPYYDANIAKLIVHASTREECLKRLKRALDEYIIGGVTTNLPLHKKVLNCDAFINGTYDIHFLESFMKQED
ncbi:MAG: acetyl-CoA carboxylase biotin carboxylase subunit [Alphaproteobacteria bacterium]|nr:acetyl-CoA carboxylase biotin carboxylase subunit [Alphaproteobacteria bacterium]MDD9919909.1 acetyl-CoA carboxylase biotin carboxylase subunit [Alphaproteobacteria bacterium]